MTEIRDMHDVQTGEIFAPQTSTKAVFDENGNDVDALLSRKADKSEVARKQDALVSGTNIKSVNGETLLGGGDIATKPKGGYMRKELELVGMAYNENTKFYEYQGITNLTEDDAINILTNGKLDMMTENQSYKFYRTNIRAIIPTSVYGLTDDVLTGYLTYSMFDGCKEIEIIKLIKARHGGRIILATKCYNMFYDCILLKEIQTILEMTKLTSTVGMFTHCYELTKVFVSKLYRDISFVDSPNLTVGDTDSTLQYMVDNAANDSAITITLHPDAYARVSQALKDKAAGKQITIASA